MTVVKGGLIRLKADHLSLSQGGVTVLDDVLFCAYDGEISVILGDSYSCKNELIRVLAGMKKAERGTVAFYDDQGRKAETIPDKRVFCPGKDGLSRELTVREHLCFGCYMRGMNKTAALLQADRIADRFGFSKAVNLRMNRLEESDQRFISVLTALTPLPDWAFLEDPSLGMDDQKCIMLWDYLHEIKKKTVVMVSTRFIQEAERLSGWLSFAVGARILCSGSVSDIIRSTGQNTLLNAYISIREQSPE